MPRKCILSSDTVFRVVKILHIFFVLAISTYLLQGTTLYEGLYFASCTLINIGITQTYTYHRAEGKAKSISDRIRSPFAKFTINPNDYSSPKLIIIAIKTQLPHRV